MIDDTLMMTMLFDFFGELLTEKQREYFDLYHNEDLSLSEIAEKTGITRQAVYDSIMRAERLLADTEKKTGLVKRWLEMRKELELAEEIAHELLNSLEAEGEFAQSAKKLIETIKRLNNGV